MGERERESARERGVLGLDARREARGRRGREGHWRLLHTPHVPVLLARSEQLPGQATSVRRHKMLQTGDEEGTTYQKNAIYATSTTGACKIASGCVRCRVRGWRSGFRRLLHTPHVSVLLARPEQLRTV